MPVDLIADSIIKGITDDIDPDLVANVNRNVIPGRERSSKNDGSPSEVSSSSSNVNNAAPGEERRSSNNDSFPTWINVNNNAKAGQERRSTVEASPLDVAVKASNARLRSPKIRRSILEDAKEALAGITRPDNFFARNDKIVDYGLKKHSHVSEIAPPKVCVAHHDDSKSKHIWLEEGKHETGRGGGAEEGLVGADNSSVPNKAAPFRQGGKSALLNTEQSRERRRAEQERRDQEESFVSLIFDTALTCPSPAGGDPEQNTNLDYEAPGGGANDEEGAIGGGGMECSLNRATAQPLNNVVRETRPPGGSIQIADIARKSAPFEARTTFLLPRNTFPEEERRIKWSPSVFLENFKSPAFTLAFRDNVARSMTEMIKRYVNIEFTSSELANQRRIKGNVDLTKMNEVFRDARQMALKTLSDLEPRHHKLALKRRQLQDAFEKLNAYVNQKDDLVGNAHKVIANEGILVEKRRAQVEEKREELRRLQKEVNGVKRKMRRLSPFVDYLNSVTQMEQHQTMFPNRLAIIHRVETLMIIRTEMIRLLEEQFREETQLREQFFKDRDFVNTIHDRSSDAIRRLNMKLDRLERRCTRWSDLISKREGEECGKKAMKGQCVRAIEYMYETVTKFKGAPINSDLPLVEKLNQVSRFIEYRLGVEKQVERMDEEEKKKDERRKKRLMDAARKHQARKQKT